MTILRRAYVKVAPDTTQFDKELKDRLRKIKADDAGEKLGKSFGSAFTRRFESHLKALHIAPIDLKANPRDALAAIEKTERELKALSRAADTVELRVKAETALGELHRFRKKLGDVADVGQEGAFKFFAGFSQKIGPLLARAPISPHLIGAVAAASPLIAATVTAGIVGGISAGAVAGGIAVALRDPRVDEEVQAFGETLNTELNNAFRDFVPATVGGIRILRSELIKLRPDLEAIGAEAAKLVAPLAHGAGKFISGVSPGVLASLEKAGPVVRQLDSVMGQLGRSAGSALETIASGSNEAALALSDMGTTADLALKGAAISVRTLTFSYAASVPPLGRMIMGWLDGGEEAQDFSSKIADMALELKQAQEKSDSLAMAQSRLDQAFAAVAPRAGYLTALVDGLRKASDLMYGATMRAADANQSYEASWDSLSESVKANKRTLDVQTAAGRANRDALKDLLARTNDLFYAEIETGSSIAQATKKHQDRIAAVKEEARRLHLNKDETARLIATYGRIPKAKSTDLLLEGVNKIVERLTDLYLWQRALATGQTINQVRGGYQGSARAFKAAGGPIFGPGTKTSDSVPIMASAGEHMWTAKEVDAVGGHGHMYRLREAALAGNLKGYAAGGYIAPVDTSRHWPFEIDVRGTRIPSRREVASKVAPSFGPWPAGPWAQRGDSGIWRSIIALVRNAGIPYRVSSTYRPGDPLWHGSGRAVDFGGFNQDRLARFFLGMQSKVLEMIHRTSYRDYAYTRGRNKGSFNEGLMEAHRNHLHIAMAGGGIIGEPILGVGASGRTYSFGERGPETVTPGVGGEVHFHFHGPVASRKAAEDMVLDAYNRLVQARKIPGKPR